MAEVGKAWWLLCQASPRVGIAISARLRDWSVGLEVAVAEDVAERVDAVGEVVEDEDADEAAPEQAGEAAKSGAADHPAEEEGKQQAADRPVDEGAVDPADDRVLEQVGREALLVAALGVDEEPAHVGVEEAAQGAAPAVAVVDVGAVRVALLVGEGVVLAVVGDPGDDRALDRRRAEDRQQRRAATASVLKARWVRWRWKPTVIPSPVRTYMPRKRKTSLQCSALPQTCQAAKAERDERDQRDQAGDDPVAGLVLDRLDVRGQWAGGCRHGRRSYGSNLKARSRAMSVRRSAPARR